MLNYGELAYFVFFGYVGSVAYVFIRSDEWEDLTTFDAVRRNVLGLIAGGLYFFLYSEHNFPNSIMCFVSGYTGVSFIEGLIDKYTKLTKK